MIDTTLEKLGLRDEEIKTFLFLLENGAQTAGTMAKKTGLSRPSLYGFLKKLQNSGLVVESQKNAVKTFQASSKEKIQAVMNERIKELEKGKSDIETVFAELQKGAITSAPKFQFFEGREGARHVFKDVLLYSNTETKSYWPIKKMIEVIGEDAFRYLNKERIKRNIYTQAIWPEKQVVDIKDHPYLGVGDDFLREIRIAPKEIDFSMGYWIYENKVSFVSSQKEAFGFIVESKELVEMLSSQFDLIWKVSKKIEVPKVHTDPFLKEVWE
jgi:sugar-specific transcriptional regulator TrmB